MDDIFLTEERKRTNRLARTLFDEKKKYQVAINVIMFMRELMMFDRDHEYHEFYTHHSRLQSIEMIRFKASRDVYGSFRIEASCSFAVNDLNVQRIVFMLSLDPEKIKEFEKVASIYSREEVKFV